MSDMKTFYCLRCEHRFAALHNTRKTVERTCPKCGSNSVRLNTPAAAARFKMKSDKNRGG